MVRTNFRVIQGRFVPWRELHFFQSQLCDVSWLDTRGAVGLQKEGIPPSESSDSKESAGWWFPKVAIDWMVARTARMLVGSDLVR